MLFADDVVKVDPPEGDIWPNSSVEVTIIFRPDKAETYNRTAFCDITGRESRLPLRVTGTGIGPKVSPSNIETIGHTAEMPTSHLDIVGSILLRFSGYG